MATNPGRVTWRGRVTMAIAATICSVGLTRAGVIEGPATYLAAGHYAKCIITNVTKSERTIQAESIGAQGNSYGMWAPATLAPGATWSGNIQGGGGMVRCRWTVEGVPSSYRASLCTSPTMTSSCQVQVRAD